MRRICMVLLVAALPACAQWVQFGRSETRLTGGGGIGFSTPVNPLATRLDAGWSLAGGVGLQNGAVGIMVDVLVTGLGINSATLARQGARHGTQTFWALTLDPIIHVNERGPADFYLTGGAGLYGQHTTYRASSGSGSQYDLIRVENSYKPGVNGGAGFAFNVGDQGLKLFVEARYHYLFTGGRNVSLIPVTVGVRF